MEALNVELIGLFQRPFPQPQHESEDRALVLRAGSGLLAVTEPIPENRRGALSQVTLIN